MKEDWPKKSGQMPTFLSRQKVKPSALFVGNLCQFVKAIFEKALYAKIFCQIGGYQEMCHKNKYVELKESSPSKQKIVFKVSTQMDSVIKTSYMVANLIPKKKNQSKNKLCADNEIIK